MLMLIESARAQSRWSPLCPYVLFALLWYSLAFLFPRDPHGMQPAEGAFPIWLSMARDGVWVLLSVGGAVSWVRRWRAEGRMPLPTGRPERALVWGFVATAGLGLPLAALHTTHRPFADVFRYDVRDLLMYGTMLLLAGVWLHSRSQTSCWVRSFVAGAVIVGILGYVQAYVFPETRFERRTFSTLSNANNFSFVMGFLFLLAIMRLDSKERWSWKWWALAALGGGSVLLSQSIGGLIFLFCVGAASLLASRHRVRICLSLLAAGAVALLSVLPTRVPQELYAKATHNFAPEPTRISVQQRQRDLNAFAEALSTSDWRTPLFWCSVALGSWTSTELIRHEPLFLRTLRNSGALVTLGLITVIFGSGWIGLRKGRQMRRAGQFREASLLLSVGLFLLVAFLTLFQFTPFLYRFPINFLAYTFCAVALYYPMRTSAAQEQSQ